MRKITAILGIFLVLAGGALSFAHAEPVSEGSCAVGYSSPSTAWYFAEGCVRTGFDTYLTLVNPNLSNARADVTYFFGDASIPQLTDYIIAAQSRRTVKLNLPEELGVRDDVRGDVSMKIDSDLPVVAERPMYFQTGNGISGGHNGTGATSPSNLYYFGIGETGSGYEEWISVLNPGSEWATLTFAFDTSPGDTYIKSGLEVAPQARATYKINDLLGPDMSYSAKLDSTQPIVAERSIYFTNTGMQADSSSGGICLMGQPSLSTQYYFAEGCTRDGFDEYILIHNPNEDCSITITVRFLLEDGSTPDEETRVLEPGMSSIIRPIPFHDVSTCLSSIDPFLAERRMFFNYGSYGSNWRGGHGTIGATTPAKEWYFAEGCTLRSGFDEWLSIMNPGATSSTFIITYYTQERGMISQEPMTIRAGSRLSLNVNAYLGVGYQFGCKVEVISGSDIVVERPIYFQYGM